jgi:uncharacterized protein (DUF983 family)
MKVPLEWKTNCPKCSKIRIFKTIESNVFIKLAIKCNVCGYKLVFNHIPDRIWLEWWLRQ